MELLIHYCKQSGETCLHVAIVNVLFIIIDGRLTLLSISIYVYIQYELDLSLFFLA